MKAAVYTKYGPPEVVQVKEVNAPAPKDRLFALNKIIQLCIVELKGNDEMMMYGCPRYANNIQQLKSPFDDL